MDNLYSTASSSLVRFREALVTDDDTSFVLRVNTTTLGGGARIPSDPNPDSRLLVLHLLLSLGC